MSFIDRFRWLDALGIGRLNPAPTTPNRCTLKAELGILCYSGEDVAQATAPFPHTGTQIEQSNLGIFVPL